MWLEAVGEVQALIQMEALPGGRAVLKPEALVEHLQQQVGIPMLVVLGAEPAEVLFSQEGHQLVVQASPLASRAQL